MLGEYLNEAHSEYEILAPVEGKKLLRLEMLGGTPTQLDTVIAPLHSDDPVALLETKWLKEARHHNDKGAWIMQLKAIRETTRRCEGWSRSWQATGLKGHLCACYEKEK